MKTLFYSIVAFLMVTAVSGCTIGRSVDQSLEGTKWRLVQLNGHELIPTFEKEIIVIISDKGIHGYGGCNQFGNDGKLLMRSGKASIKSIVSSAKSCGAEIDKQETELHHALMAAKTYKISGEHLELYDDNGKPVLLFEKIDMK
ncbi:MAG: hypothetical protein DSY55_04390 [Clostridia bacterium]|nr:MAG: hypothetical protein DSY55_04390 [Clostridia bacterium]